MPIEKIKGCIGCGECMKSCPADVIRLNETESRAEIVYPEDCQVCSLCAIYCPVSAITLTSEKTLPPLTAWG
ncbi:MAG: 4Fe-4S binding protein [Oligoflexales bacterium]|nr:4Fe-4S binding protein [Oligoflexales bacterium]